MENLSLSRFLILAKVIQHQGILEGEFIRLIQQLPPETLQSTNLPIETNSIYQTLHRLKKSNYIRIGTPRFIYPTPEGLLFYRNIMSFCTPISKNDKVPIAEPQPILSQSNKELPPTISENVQNNSESHLISKKNTLKKSPFPIDNIPKTPKIDSVKSKQSPPEKKESITGIVSQFCKYFIPIIDDYHWKVSEKKLEEIMAALYHYWIIKPDVIQQTLAFPSDTTSKIIGWLGLNSASFVKDERADIIAGLEFCWNFFQKEKQKLKK